MKNKAVKLWADKTYRGHFIFIILFIVIGFILLGIPGALILESNNFITNVVLGENTISSPDGDSAWPAALAMTLIWPWGFFIALYLVRKLKINNKNITASIYGSFIFFWGLALTWIFCM